jgi:hypothetical protein
MNESTQSQAIFSRALVPRPPAEKIPWYILSGQISPTICEVYNNEFELGWVTKYVFIVIEQGVSKEISQKSSSQTL